MGDSLRDYLDFAVETAYLAGRVTLGYYQTGLRVDRKADQTPVTVADVKSEEQIRSRIEKQYPGHAIVGEEFGAKGSAGATHRWWIDPIDGTTSFMRGVPLYSVLLGLEIEGRAEVGVAYFPALDEMIAAATGEGCWWNGRRARVSSVSRLADATVCFTEIASFERYGRSEDWGKVMRSTGLQMGWHDAFGYLLVATGRADWMLDPVMQPWDSAPFPPILSEAGGYFGDWSGNTTIYADEGMATTRLLLPSVLALLGQSAE
jgi:myo-inositol-1(or 4)-monophosphatase